MEQINKDLNENSKGKEVKVFTYKFLNQDFKVKEKDAVIDALDGDLETYNVGKVLNINEDENGKNTIEISTQKDLPKILSITKDEFVSSKAIIEAIRRFVDSAIKNEKKYKATYEILKKNYPKIKNIKEGEAIIREGDFLKESFKAVESMDSSYLYFQGPPGVGKHIQLHM